MTQCQMCGRVIGEGIPSPAWCAVCEQTIESDEAVAALPELPPALPVEEIEHPNEPCS